MTVREETIVTFYSPGTLFAESTSRGVPSADPELAAPLAKDIVERHGARPYGFRFERRLVSDPVPDGRGGELQVEPKTIEDSVTGIYFIDGLLVTYDDLVARADPKEETLRANMRGNDWPIVCVSTNSYRSTQPFTEGDFVVDASGKITARGDAPKLVAYRAEKIAEFRVYYGLDALGPLR